MNSDAKILIQEHGGLMEQGLLRRLRADGREVFSTSEEGIDVLRPDAVEEFFAAHRPQVVIIGSVLAGGISANQQRPGEFIRANLLAQTNGIHAASLHGCRKLLYIAASCVYPKECQQPMQEEDLMTGPLEPTSAAYATAKLAGMEMCRAYRRQFGLAAVSVIPSTVYGPGENGDPQTGHVLGALMQKFVEAAQTNAPEVKVWGTGKARREFLYIDDFVEAALFLLGREDVEDVINAGVGEDISIADLAGLIARVAGYKGRIAFDETRPDGAPRKLLDCTRINELGWRASTMLEEGVMKTFEQMNKVDV